MKTYEVELRRVSYVTYYVEADNPEQAEMRAWEELERDAESLSIENASWDVESIEEKHDENK
jgi:hypothetical protein